MIHSCYALAVLLDLLNILLILSDASIKAILIFTIRLNVVQGEFELMDKTLRRYRIHMEKLKRSQLNL